MTYAAVAYESSLVGLDPFLAQGIYCLQYKCQAKPLYIVVYAMYVAIYMCRII